MMEALNIFFVPVISFAIYSKRNNKPMVFDCACLVNYCCWAIADSIIVFLAMKVLEIVTGIGALPSSQFYTIIAVVIAFIVPYIYEIYKKYVNISCEIKEKSKEK